MDKFREFRENFIVHFQTLCKTMKGKSNGELDEALIRQSSSEEQCQVIGEICRDVDLEHDMIEKMINSNKTPGAFLKQDIIDTIKEVHPDATDEEVNQVVEVTMDAMEKDFEHDAKEFSKEISMLSDSLQITTDLLEERD